MNIKVPRGMSSPTVIVIGGKDSEAKNDMTLRRMDILERKLDKQYESFYKKTPKSTPDYDKILKVFMARMGSLEKSIKKLASLEEAIKNLPTRKVSVNNLSSSFNKLFERLEKAIKDARPKLIPSPS